jgi:hypothetical protein
MHFDTFTSCLHFGLLHDGRVLDLGLCCGHDVAMHAPFINLLLFNRAVSQGLPLHHNNNDAHAATLGSIIWRCDAVRAHRSRRDKSCSPKSVTAERNQNLLAFF